MNNQLSISKSILLHLLPGAIGTLVYILLAPLFLRNHYPAILALLVTAGVFIVPIELGYLLIQAKKNGSFGKVIEYREALPLWQYFVLPLGMIVWGFLASGALSILDLVTAKQIFGWLPGWFFIFDVEQFKAFPREALLITFWAGLFINGLIGPIVEELYFRGYLLPRLSRLGNWSPLINISLFSLYHFWTPWQFISRIIWLLPWGYLVQKKKNIYLMIISHCTANILGWLLAWGAILNA
ncbi:MAG TPA: CPBP family intramembrane glutamic endopeptidase [Anaerolineales bacterium]|nr:CPBP family intramembrane glutamic endopeptidase [Anaerolineales bacterium]